MVVFNYSGREINAKIVYYGPGLSGKTTNIERIYGQVPESRRGKMVSMKTRSDRTLFFDFLPVQGGDIKGFRTRYLLYTVPGQVHYNATRKLVLKGSDAIVFVADSDPALREANVESLKNLEENLAEYQLSLDRIPVILQYNKRDVSNPLSVEQLNSDLNSKGWPYFEAVAIEGKGVWDTFRAATDALFKTLEANLGGEEKSEGAKASPQEKESSLVPPVLEPNAYRPAGTASPPAGGQPAGQSGRQPSSETDSSRLGADSVVRLSGQEAVLSRKKESQPPAGSGAGQPARTGGADWGESFVPPGSKPKSKPSGAGKDGIGYIPSQADSKSGERSAPSTPPGSRTPHKKEVIRVPVEVTTGKGKVHIEIVLELHVRSGEKVSLP